MPFVKILRNAWTYPRLLPVAGKPGYGNGKVYVPSLYAASVIVSLDATLAVNGVGGYRDYGATIGVELRELLGAVGCGYSDGEMFEFYGDVQPIHKRRFVFDLPMPTLAWSPPATGVSILPRTVPTPALDSALRSLFLDLNSGVVAEVIETAQSWAWQD